MVSNLIFDILETFECLQHLGRCPSCIAEILYNIQEQSDIRFNSIHFIDLKISEICFWNCWKRRMPNNPDDPSNKFLKILDMEPIAS